MTAAPIYDDGQLRGIAFGSAGDGLRWVLRADRPSWHPSDGSNACCWAKGDADPRWLTDPDAEVAR